LRRDKTLVGSNEGHPLNEGSRNEELKNGSHRGRVFDQRNHAHRSFALRLVSSIVRHLANITSTSFEKFRLLVVTGKSTSILGAIILRQGHLFLPVIVLIALLLNGFTPTYGAIVATLSVIAISWVRRDTGLRRRTCLAALRGGAEHTVPVAMAYASAGIVIGVVLQTGLTLRFTAFLVEFAGGSLMVALLVAMLAGIILGMGMPTTPAYIMQAALLVPALIKLGVQPIAAHMFAFYPPTFRR
jgi:TRAP-type uncharacterized transport system fused permease subunit